MPRNADAVQIKKAYRKAALLFHPDVNPEPAAVQQTQLINEAYSVLSDSLSKKRYDAMLHYGFIIPEPKKEESKYDQDKGRKYGTHHKYGSYAPPKPKETVSNEDFRKLENALFYSLMMLGIISIFLSVHDLIFTKFNGIHSLSGIIFALSFTCLLLYNWVFIYRSKQSGTEDSDSQ